MKNPLYDQLKDWITENLPDYIIPKDDGQYFMANSKNGKRFISFNSVPMDSNSELSRGKTYLGIREDGDTRTVFNGKVNSVDDLKLIWELTL